MKKFQIIIMVSWVISAFVTNSFATNSFVFSEKLVELQKLSISEIGLNKIQQKTDSLKQVGSEEQLIESLIDYALYLQFYGDYDASVNYFYEAIDLANKNLNDELKGISYLGLANVYFRIGNHQKSFEYNIKAVDIFNELINSPNLLFGKIFIGQVYMSLGKFEDAKYLYAEIYDEAKAQKDSMAIAEIYNHLGAFQVYEGRFNKSINFYNKSLFINNSMKNRINAGINYANIGEAYMLLQKPDSAFWFLNKALEIQRETNYRSCIIFIYRALAQLYELQNQQILAEEYYFKSIELAKEIGELTELSLNYKLISDHFGNVNDYKRANHYLTKFVQLEDSLSKISNQLSINELNIKYKVDNQERELLAIQIEKDLQEESIKAKSKTIRLQKLIIAIVIIGMIGSLLFTLYFLRSRRKLKEANKTKDVLFSIIGHDLKGPMGNIKQIVENLQINDPNIRERYLKILPQPVEKSYDLLEDLLLWSQSINNKLTSDFEVLNLNTLVQESKDFLKAQAGEKEIAIRNLISDDLWVRGDRNQLSTIIRNLISNAIKFTHGQGEITIHQECVNNKVTLLVTDTGLGIDANSIKKIFRKNAFFTTFGTNNEKGSGLGLVLVQNFIRNHGSKLSIESKVGSGSTFSFQLQLAKTPK